MMSSDLFFRDKISVAVLGATNLMGQKLIQLLASHPWFQVVALCDLEPFVGQSYGEAISLSLSVSLPASIVNMPILPCKPPLNCALIFSTLDPQVAAAIEIPFAAAGYFVISLFSCAQDQHVPQVVATVNPEHLTIIEKQHFAKGGIVAIPQSFVIELTVALKPLLDQFGLEAVQVMAFQPDSQTSDPQLPVIFPEGWQAKVEREPLKILGTVRSGEIQDADFQINVGAMCMPDVKEQQVDISVRLKKEAHPEQLIQAWLQFASGPQRLQLPTAPFQALFYFPQNDFSSEVEHVSHQKGVKIAHLCPQSLLNYNFTLIPSTQGNRMVEAALLNAELLVSRGKIYW